MSVRNFVWRACGVGLILVSAATAVPAANGSAGAALAGVMLALTGLVFAVQGKRVALALRIERSPHRHLPALLNARRARRTGER
jgi:hypothetical protein